MTTKPVSETPPCRTRAPVSIEVVISTVLRFGVLAAALIILVGVAQYVGDSGARAVLFAHPGIPPGADKDPRSLRIVLDQLGPGQPAAITDLGLLLLIATPVIGVMMAAVAFALERDWTYVGLATFVFAVLIIGFAVGRA